NHCPSIPCPPRTHQAKAKLTLPPKSCTSPLEKSAPHAATGLKALVVADQNPNIPEFAAIVNVKGWPAGSFGAGCDVSIRLGSSPSCCDCSSTRTPRLGRYAALSFEAFAHGVVTDRPPDTARTTELSREA